MEIGAVFGGTGGFGATGTAMSGSILGCLSCDVGFASTRFNGTFNDCGVIANVFGCDDAAPSSNFSELAMGFAREDAAPIINGGGRGGGGGDRTSTRNLAVVAVNGTQSEGILSVTREAGDGISCGVDSQGRVGNHRARTTIGRRGTPGLVGQFIGGRRSSAGSPSKTDR